jgi:hypothetical protein
MTPPPPAPFAISDAALKQIRAQLDAIRKRFGTEAIPAIMWVDARLDNPSQPAISFYDSIDDIRNDVIVVNGLPCVLDVSDADKSRFLGKTLNYRNGQLVLD